MTAPTAPADLTGVDLDLVDETWEDRVCGVPECSAESIIGVTVLCGCGVEVCNRHYESARQRVGSLVFCPFCGLDRFRFRIVRTWPVTR